MALLVDRPLLNAVRGRNGEAPALPKLITPGMHAAIDYMTAATFFISGIRNWRRRRRAAVGAFACGAIEAGSVIMTDMRGGIWKLVPFETHLKMDYGLAGFVAAVPSLLLFGDRKPSGFFRMQGLMIAAVAAMTRERNGGGTRKARGRSRKATARRR